MGTTVKANYSLRVGLKTIIYGAELHIPSWLGSYIYKCNFYLYHKSHLTRHISVLKSLRNHGHIIYIFLC